MLIDVIIPALNEEKSIGLVINDLPKNGLIRDCIVCNNNSTDHTGEVAKIAGATVVDAPLPGYGNACLKGIAHLRQKAVPPEIVVFMDADFSDFPEQITEVIAPILRGEAELVIGSRALGKAEKGALMPQQIFGNWLATRLIKLIYGYSYSDLGPFRSIKWKALERLNMQDKNYGWTVEMQIKAVQKGLRITEVPVNYRVRIGQSKVAGTLKGTLGAGYKILLTIAKYALLKK